MNDERSDASDRERLLDEVVTAYLKAAEAGQAPDHQELLARHADLAPELAEFLADQEQVERWTAPLRAAGEAARMPGVADDTPLPDAAPAGGGPGGGLRPVEGFELLEEIGQGGMSVVYRARQKGLNRLVALKLLCADPWLAADSLRRFRNEAEIVAGLDHPGIVPIHEVGEWDGRLYFSMKLMDGGSLAGQLPRYMADPKAAAGLVAAVARAVHHAHQRGVLHRDLKPSNILLDADGRPHVTDFGLARRVEADSSLTQSGAIVGTPGYMAPEQATGRRDAITTTTDVHGLGAVLYALLTGTAPFQGESVLETLERVKGQDPQPPRQRNPKVDRDLETVCLKCLQKEPSRRYASALELAEDLECWLRGGPIRARRVSARERLGKWVRRRPALAALGALAALSGLGLVAGLLWHNAQLQRAAEHEKATAGRERQQRRLARQAVDRMYTQVATKWLADEPRLTDLQRSFLEDALHFYQELSREETDDPTIRAETARAQRYMGDILAKLERRPEAEQAYGQAITSFAQLLTEHSDSPDEAHDLAIAYTGLGTLLRNAGRDREAEKAYRQGLEITERLRHDHPDRTDYQHRAGILWMDLSTLVPPPEAEHVLGRAREIYEQLLADSPDKADFHTALGGVLNNLAIRRLEKGNPAEARELLEEAVRQQRAALKINPRSQTARLSLRNHYSNLGGDVLPALGEGAEAVKAAREGLALAQKLVEEFPAVPLYEGVLADSQHDLGRALSDLGQLGEAEGAFRQAKALREKAVARSPKVPPLRGLLAETCASLAGLLEAGGRYQEAVAERRRALELTPDSLARKVNLAWALVVPATATRQDAAEAVALARQAVDQDSHAWQCWNALGGALYRQGEWEQALQALERAVELQKGGPPPTHLFMAMAQWHLGHKEDARQRYREVAQFIDRNGDRPPERRLLLTECAALLGIPEAPSKDKEVPGK